MLTPRNGDQQSPNEGIMRCVPAEAFESLSVDDTEDMNMSVIYPAELSRR